MNYPPQQGPGPYSRGGYSQQPPQWGQVPGGQPRWGPQWGSHHAGVAHPGGFQPQPDFWQQVAGGPPPGPPRRDRRWLVLGVVAAGVALLATAVVLLVVALLPDEIEAGECMSLEDERGGAMSSASCGSADSDYRVISVRGGQDLDTCGDDYANVYRGATYCVVLDVRAGDCLTSFQEDAGILPLKAACRSAQDQVTRVVPGQDPESACGPDEGYYVFSRETVCFAEAQGV